MEELLDRLEGVLEEKDLKSFKKALQKTIDEKVKERIDEQSKELNEKNSLLVEDQVKTKLNEEKEKLISEYDQKLVDIENGIIEKLDSFLDTEISENISDETIEKIAKTETLEPLVEGILKLFEEKYVSPDVEGSKLLEQKTRDIEELRKQNSDLMAKKMELNEAAEKASVRLLVIEKTSELSESEREKVLKFFEDESFERTESKIDDYIEMITEASEKMKKEEDDEEEEEKEKDKEKNYSENDKIKKEEEEKEEGKEDDIDEDVKAAQRYI